MPSKSVLDVLVVYSKCFFHFGYLKMELFFNFSLGLGSVLNLRNMQGEVAEKVVDT